MNIQFINGQQRRTDEELTQYVNSILQGGMGEEAQQVLKTIGPTDAPNFVIAEDLNDLVIALNKRTDM